jgi:hypothetical protein
MLSYAGIYGGHCFLFHSCDRVIPSCDNCRTGTRKCGAAGKEKKKSSSSDYTHHRVFLCQINLFFFRASQHLTKNSPRYLKYSSRSRRRSSVDRGKERGQLSLGRARGALYFARVARGKKNENRIALICEMFNDQLYLSLSNYKLTTTNF